MNRIARFLRDDSGAVTVDWVAITAGVILLAILVVFSIFNNGVAGLVSKSNETMADLALELDKPTLDTTNL